MPAIADAQAGRVDQVISLEQLATLLSKHAGRELTADYSFGDLRHAASARVGCSRRRAGSSRRLTDTTRRRGEAATDRAGIAIAGWPSFMLREGASIYGCASPAAALSDRLRGTALLISATASSQKHVCRRCLSRRSHPHGIVVGRLAVVSHSSHR